VTKTEREQGEEKQMKNFAILFICCFLLSYCSKKDNNNEEKKEVLNQEPILQTQEIEVSYTPEESEVSRTVYVFDIESFRFLDEFPWSILEIKAMYPDEDFEEKTSTNEVKGLFGDWFSLESQNISFSYLGENIDEAILYIVEIFTPKYQCNTMQIIGMPVKDLENLSGKEINLDKKIFITTDLYVLSIETDGDIVKSYTILREL
jgi:hypothetical protein